MTSDRFLVNSFNIKVLEAYNICGPWVYLVCNVHTSASAGESEKKNWSDISIRGGENHVSP